MNKAVIVSSVDDYANGVKPRELTKFLEKNGFVVSLLPGAHRTGLKDVVDNFRISKSKLRFLLITAGLGVIKLIRIPSIQRSVKSLINVHQFREYGEITHSRLVIEQPDLIVCESNIDMGFIKHARIAKIQILDLPCPSAEELYFGSMINQPAYETFKKVEADAYGSADALSFHWHTYSDYVRKTKYNGNNIIDMGYGTTKKDKVASYSKDARVIFLGYLSGYWVNIELLEKLCEAYPNLDVYGGPKPPEGSKINYKGYAPSLDVMADYQFGLTTISDDELRKNSFSSKHLEYISYGLPVFTPDWRRDSKLDDSSIYYSDEVDFMRKVIRYSARDMWQGKQKSALKTANSMTWGSAFVELGNVIKTQMGKD